MKRFGAPHMSLIHLENEDIICASKYCDGYTCPLCEDHENCGVQTPCTAYVCPHYLCPEY